MIPLILTITFGFISFLASAFVILRIVIPILPPHPLSRRVPPSEFGLPNYNFRSLSSADKSHLWLASFDLLALCVFIWQAVLEYSGEATGLADARDAAVSARLWFTLTIRQSCLLVVSALTLIHIRMGRSVSFGQKHWMIWVPTLLLSLTSTTLAAVLADASIPSFFAGIVAYSAATAVLSTANFGGLVYTLVVIKRNLAALNEPTDNWPPVKMTEKPWQSFATEDVDALREGSSWLTSDAASSRHDSMSNWSFSTHHTRQGSMRRNSISSLPSLQLKSSYWFNSPTMGANASIPPVPPLPSVYRGNTSPARVIHQDPDPFRRDAPGRPRLESQSSWLTSPSVSQATMSSWSYPASSVVGVNAALLPNALPSRSTPPLTGSVIDVNAALLPHEVATPMASAVDLNATLLPHSRNPGPIAALANAKVLGGYGYTGDSEKGIASLAVNGSEVNISYSRYAFWLLSVWVPFGLSLPYLISGTASIESLQVMLMLSVTLSSPLLALNVIIRSPLPIPTGLFDTHADPPSVIMRAPSSAETLAAYCREYKKSSSVTVVEGRRSGDVWISQGDAVDGKGRLGRALGLMTPLPRLAVLPPGEEQQDGEVTPPLPMQEETFHATTSVASQSTNSAELGGMRKESKTFSHFSGDEDFATRIMIAQRHYSAVATTVVVPASPERTETPDGLLTVATGVDMAPPMTPTSSSHLRSRSVPSIIGQALTTPDINVPPSQPLPPTPPNIRSAKQTAKKLLHRKSRSSDFSFGAAVNPDVMEIDALTAGVLPLLVPGLKLGEDIKIRNWEFSPPLSSTVTKKPARNSEITVKSEFGFLDRNDFAITQFHSTVQGEPDRVSKVTGHKKNHGLPSLVLDQDVVRCWETDINHVLTTKTGEKASPPASPTNLRNTIRVDETLPNLNAHRLTESQVQQQVPMTGITPSRETSIRYAGLRAEIPQTMSSARTSLVTLIPPSATSTVTLFETGSIFEPDAQSTPYDTQKNRATAKPRTSSCHSSIVYIKSGEKPSELITCKDHSTSPTTLAPVTKSLVPSVSTLRGESSAFENKLAMRSGSLRQLALLKDRDTNKEGEAFKFAGTRPLILSKNKRRLKVTCDENVDNSGNKHLKPLQLGRSDSSKMRGILRRDEILPTVVVRPPSTNT